MTLTTSTINPGLKVTIMCMEWSTKQILDHSQLFITTMLPVRCAMIQWGWQSQWSKQKLTVHQHGLWSTLATSCQPTIAIITPCKIVLTITQTQYQGVIPIPTVPYWANYNGMACQPYDPQNGLSTLRPTCAVRTKYVWDKKHTSVISATVLTHFEYNVIMMSLWCHNCSAISVAKLWTLSNW